LYKLKNTYIDKMIEAGISSREIDFLLYIAVYQNEEGIVESVYYKDVCNATEISVQKFYDVIHSLQDKGLISYEKINSADLRVRLVNNDFFKAEYKKGDVGYLNVAQNDFGSHKFRKLKAGSKLLYLYMQRFVNGKHMTMDHFYEKFCEMFGVVKKSLQQYVHELKMNKLLFISRKRNKAYNYEIMMKRSTVLFKKSIQMLREKEYYVNNICALIKTNFSKMAENSKDKAIEDIASLVDTQRAGQHRNFIAVVLSAIKKSLTIQRKEGKKKLELNAALVNRCLTELLEQPAV